MGAISDARAGLASTIEAGTGLKGHPTWPDQVVCPCAIVGPPTGSYDDDFDEDVTLTFPVTLLILPAQNAGPTRGQKAVDPYLEPKGEKSVRQAVAADPSLGGKASSAVVKSFDRYDALKDTNDLVYWGAVLQVEVYA